MQGRNWKSDLGRLVGGTVGTILALTATGWPSNAAEAAWIGLGGAVVGFFLVVGAERVDHWRREAARVQTVERQMVDERKTRDEERRLWERQLLVAERSFQVSQVETKVFAEAQRSGEHLDIAAILARIENQKQARNIDKPLPPFDPNPDGKS